MSITSTIGGMVLPFARPRRDMQTAIVQEVRAYWEALRAGRAVPLRSEVDPRGIERALDNAFILERVAPNVARFRVCGGYLNDVMGMEVRGMPVTAMLAPADRPRAGAVIAAVFDMPQAAEFILTAETGMGRPELSARLLVLPMKSDSGQIDRALGCFVTGGTVGRAPRRFTLVEALTSPIATGRPLPTPPLSTPPLSTRALRPVAGLAEPRAPYQPANRAHLRLVKSET